MDTRTLNRTLLERQHLLGPAGPAGKGSAPGPAGPHGVAGTVHHLLGLQSQVPTSPYPGLWTRLPGLDFAEPGRLLRERRLVRLTLMRGTVHLVTAEDAPLLRAWTQPVLERVLRGSRWARGVAGVDKDRVVAQARDLLAERPLTPAELRTELGARWPGADPASLVTALRLWAPLVQIPPRGVWGEGGGPVYAYLDDWLAHPLPGAGDSGGTGAGGGTAAAEETGPARDRGAVSTLIRRYLAAFGPATPADMQKWSGVTGLRREFAALDLRTYTAPDGRLLYDLPEAALADPGREIPPLLVADFDNLLLSHADRTRILAPEHKTRVITVNGLVRGSVLLDGFVAGTWEFEPVGPSGTSGTAAIAVTPFVPLRPADREALEARCLALLAAAYPGVTHQVRFTEP